MFVAEGDTYQLIVNGEEVPLSIDQSDIDAVREATEPYYYHDSGKWQGYANITYWSETMREGGWPGPAPLTGGQYWFPHYPHQGWRSLPAERCVP